MRRPFVSPALALAAAAAAHPAALRAQATPASGGAERAAALADSAARTQTEAGLRRSIALRREAAALYRAEGRPREAGQMLHQIGRTYRALGHPDSALAVHREALAARREAGDRRGEGASLGSIGLAHADAGRVDSAVAYYRQALALQQVGGAAERAAVATTLANIGAAYTTLGHLDLALRHHRQALAVRRELADRAGQLVALNNVGAVHAMLGRPDSAAHYYARALALAREARDAGAEATALGNLGAVHMDRGHADSAVAYFRDALAIQRGLSDRGAPVTTLGNIASAFLALRRTDSARHYFEGALAAAREARSPLAEGRATGNLGALHAALGRRDSALHHFERAVAIGRAVDDPFGVAETLASIAQLHLSQPGRTRDDVARARARLDTAAAVYAATRSRTGAEADAIAFAEKHRELFATWALAWLAGRDASDATGDASGSGVRAALAVADRGRARALLDQIRGASAGARRRGTADDPHARPGADLAAEADSLLAVVSGPRTAVLSYLVTADTLVTWLALPGRPLRVARTALRRDSLDVLVRALHDGIAAPDARTTPARTRAAAALRALEPGAARESGSGAAGAAALERLGGLLVPAALRRELPPAGDLVVVPHGALALVPFAALPAGASGGEPLGLRYAVRVAPSLAALAAAQARPTRLAPDGVPNPRRRALAAAIVVGDPAMPELPGTGERLEPLPAARREAQWVAARLGVRALTGAAATESAVAGALARAPLVHLATHGMAFGSDARARDSFVALAPDSVADGLLTVGEVLDAPAPALAADLVVLSACQSGSGVLWQSEGTVGLSRAFLARGARSVLVSLWSVSDDATELLMRRLYAHWLGDADGPSVAEALRRAQGDVRGTPGFGHPRYWAAFQLVGAR